MEKKSSDLKLKKSQRRFQYSRELSSRIGDSFERRDLAIKAKVELQNVSNIIKQAKSSGASAEDVEKLELRRDQLAKMKADIVKKYNNDLKDYKKAEKELKKSLAAEFKMDHSDEHRGKIKKIAQQNYVARKMEKFYKEHLSLTWDAEYKYNICVTQDVWGAKAILFEEEAFDNLQQAKVNLSDVSDEVVSKSKDDITSKAAAKREQHVQIIQKIKKDYKDGELTRKGKRKILKETKMIYKYESKLIKSLGAKEAAKQDVKLKNYEYKRALRSGADLIEGEIDDITKKTPVENRKSIAVIDSIIGFIFPFVPAIRTKQFKRLFILLPITLISYAFIAYSIGFGNVNGNGIVGLWKFGNETLIDDSRYWIVEGIISFYLLLMVLAFYLVVGLSNKRAQALTLKGGRISSWREAKQWVEQNGFPYIISLPALFFIILIVFVPISATVLIAFTNMNSTARPPMVITEWAGIDNFKRLFDFSGVIGRSFKIVVQWTLVWTFLASTLQIAIGFFLAVLMKNPRIKGKRFFRSVYLLPWAVPAFVTIMVFSMMAGGSGIIPDILNKLTGEKYLIKQSEWMTKTTLIFIQAWLGSAYIFLLTTGTIGGISPDLYEAADIDGASSKQKMRNITLPIFLAGTLPLLVGQYTFNFNNFSIIYLFNGGGPGISGEIAGSTDILVSFIYNMVLVNNNYALGSAVGLVIASVLIFFTYWGLKNSKQFAQDKLVEGSENKKCRSIKTLFKRSKVSKLGGEENV